MDHQLALRGTVVAAVGELSPQVGDFLIELSDALLNGFDVAGGAEPRLVP